MDVLDPEGVVLSSDVLDDYCIQFVARRHPNASVHAIRFSAGGYAAGIVDICALGAVPPTEASEIPALLPE